MTAHYLQTVFTPAVKAAQAANGSRNAYARQEHGETPADRLGENEAAFIGARDSFYMASVTETGWPYVQHRGGAPGFVKVLDARTLGFADFRGNRQYVSVGNVSVDDRVSLFFMDYPNQARLKVLGRLRILAPDASEATRLVDSAYKATVERLMLIEVEAFDWNCSQHITPRYTVEDVLPTIEALKARIVELEAKLAGEGAK